MSQAAYLGMVVDFDHEDTVTNVEGVHILLQGLHRICPQNVRPGFVSQCTLEACVETLQEALLSLCMKGHISKASICSLPISAKLSQLGGRITKFAQNCSPTSLVTLSWQS